MCLLHHCWLAGMLSNLDQAIRTQTHNTQFEPRLLVYFGGHPLQRRIICEHFWFGWKLFTVSFLRVCELAIRRKYEIFDFADARAWPRKNFSILPNTFYIVQFFCAEFVLRGHLSSSRKTQIFISSTWFRLACRAPRTFPFGRNLFSFSFNFTCNLKRIVGSEHHNVPKFWPTTHCRMKS